MQKSDLFQSGLSHFYMLSLIQYIYDLLSCELNKNAQMGIHIAYCLFSCAEHCCHFLLPIEMMLFSACVFILWLRF